MRRSIHDPQPVNESDGDGNQRRADRRTNEPVRLVVFVARLFLIHRQRVLRDDGYKSRHHRRQWPDPQQRNEQHREGVPPAGDELWSVEATHSLSIGSDAEPGKGGPYGPT